MTDNTRPRHVAGVTSSDPKVLRRPVADRLESRDASARVIAAALGARIITPEQEAAELAAAQRLAQTPSPRPARGDAQAAPGGGAKPKSWAEQSPAERAEEAARAFEATAAHLRRGGRP